MMFDLEMSASWVNEEEKKKLEKLGFKFRKTLDYRPEDWYSEECDKQIEFNTLEELINFIKQFGEIILTEDTIEIYNDYRE